MRYTKKMICGLEEILKQDEVIEQVHALGDMVRSFLNDIQNPSFAEDNPLLCSFGTIDIEQRLAICWGTSWKDEFDNKKSVDFEVLKTIKLLQDYIIMKTSI